MFLNRIPTIRLQVINKNIVQVELEAKDRVRSQRWGTGPVGNPRATAQGRETGLGPGRQGGAALRRAEGQGILSVS